MMLNRSNVDLEAKLFMFLFCLKEEKNKIYSVNECDEHIVYLFESYDEIKSYFVKNGMDDISDELINLCIMKKTKLGTIISLKGLCDYTIKRYKTACSATNRSSTSVESSECLIKCESCKEKDNKHYFKQSKINETPHSLVKRKNS